MGGIDRIELHEHERPTQRLVLVGIPTLGLVHVHLMYALMALRHPMNAKVRFFSPLGLPTDQGRNEVVARAIQQGASHVFFVDDDTWPPPDALLTLLGRARPIVSGLYYAKTRTPQPLVLHGQYCGTAQSWTPGDLVACYAHGMGCTLIETRVFTDLYQQGSVQVDPSLPCFVCGGSKCAGCFDTGHMVRWFYTTDARLVSADGTAVAEKQTEDVYFLERAAQCGYQPAVDTGVFAWHYDSGTNRVYPEKQYHEYRTQGTVTWDTDHGPVTWPGVQP